MEYKPSNYNVFSFNQSHDLLIANLLETSFIKIPFESGEKIYGILQQQEINEDAIIKYPFLKEKGLVVEKDIEEWKLADMKYYNIVYSKDTLKITIIPTDACNFKCSYCYQEDREFESMNKCVGESILSFLRKNCSNYKRVAINWFGGEPLLMKEFIYWFMEEAIEICKKARIPISSGMSTNGYELDVTTFRELIQRKVTYFQITVDGTEETHNHLRPHISSGDSYNKIINNLKDINANIKNYYKISIRINVTKQVLQHLMEAIDAFKIFAGNKKICIHWQLVRDYGGETVHNMDSDLLADQTEVDQYIEVASNLNLSSLYEIYFNVGAGLCSACLNNSYLIDQNAKIHKCTLAMYDKKVKDNMVGHIDLKGNIFIDEHKNAEWIIRPKVEETCKICNFYPLCFQRYCPYSRRYKEKNACFTEKERLKSLLLYMDQQNLIKSFTVKE